MKLKEAIDVALDETLEKAGNIKVYTTDDGGNLVPVTSAEIVTMRDGGTETKILVMNR
tara:strand:- start:156 stop:329 length:174 start_codon:yes stop_codon:yes gene_type:complete